MDFHIIIPARYDSARLPGKVLLDINGKPMLQHVYERALDVGAQSVTIAVDDDRVEDAAKNFGAPVCRTGKEHRSGIGRVSAAASILEFEKDEVVVALPADQPLMPAALISTVVKDLERHDHAKVATLAKKITSTEDLLDPNVTKVVLNHRNFAIYFSRAPVPWDTAHFGDATDKEKLEEALTFDPAVFYRHIDLYAFRAGFLNMFSAWDPSPIERIEALEQLRIVWHGHKIHVGLTELGVLPGVDTQAELDFVRSHF